MTEMHYYFQSKEHEHAIHSLTQHELFDKVVVYLDEHQDIPITLRHLKQVFHSEKDLEKIIDRMIHYHLLQRKEKHYALTFPIFSKKPEFPLIKSVFFKQFQQIDEKSQVWFLGEGCWRHFLKDSCDFFFGVSHSNDSFFQKNQIKNDKIAFISIQNESSPSFTLPSYFKKLQLKPSLRKTEVDEFQQLQQLLGDVSLDYFLAQAQYLVTRAAKKRKIPSKRNIFYESMLSTGIFSLTENHCFNLSYPLFDNKEENSINDLRDEWLDELTQILSLKNKSTEQIQYEKMCLYAQLLTHLKIQKLNYIKIISSYK